MLFVTIVMDGVGIGAQPDAADYGDEDSDTLGHVLQRERPSLPNFEKLGLGCIRKLPGLCCPNSPIARYGRMREVSAGKDSTTGHWELAGLRLVDPFPTYPNGFPADVIDAFLKATGCEGVLGNKAASGTAIIAELGAEHEKTGYPIVYTSADSVFQIAAHKQVIPLSRQYELCQIARTEVCVPPHGVGRVIARPFVGSNGEYTRISAERKDFSRPLPRPALHQVLQEHGVRTVSVGKIADLFDKVGFDEMNKTKSNAEGIDATLQAIRAHAADDPPTFVWTNLVDFDQEFGHRNDPAGFATALRELDEAIPTLLDALPPDAALILTADHGNDPTTPSTDHSREYVPLLFVNGNASGDANLGTRASFNDHAATVADFFGVDFDTEGVSFL